MNAVPMKTQISPDLTFETEGDLQMVHTLLKNPRYKIPERLRDKIMKAAEDTIDNSNATTAEINTACKLILEADKRNIDLVKLAMPKQVIHRHVSQYSDEELRDALQDIINEKGLVPSLGRSITDA